MGQTDLDSSLDDIIKNNKRRNPDSSRGRGRGGSSRGRGSKITSTRRPPSSFSSSLTRSPVRGRGRGRGGASSERFDSRGPNSERFDSRQSSERFDSRTNKAIAKSKLSLRGVRDCPHSYFILNSLNIIRELDGIMAAAL
jgi:hypothetical protein